ncbi:thiolase family protein [Pseudomonas sp. RIT-PI-AD]|uniref:thiolase family protein n=1 Tax=Pseudomonas sp. RIT-PI-AD TaxID=3035294 RepID=UPI0021DB7018|nr:thiolase family protein [Pseudomonas sp. RIT-PI-AD]
MSEILIISGARTPIGSYKGALAGLSAVELGTSVIRATLARAGIAAAEVDEVLLGCVLPAGVKQGPARQAALAAGLPASAGCTTINKLCGSGMKALMLAHDQLKAGSARMVIAGGMESMSNAPYLLHKGAKAGEPRPHLFVDALEDPGSGQVVGVFAQATADACGVDRAAMDAFTLESLRRARAAIQAGALDAEIVPLRVATRKGEVLVSQDEQPLGARAERIHSLKPAFAEGGSITAASASSIADGASALLLTTAAEAARHGVRPLARIVAHASHSQDPADFALAPLGALRNLFRKTGWRPDSVDLYEINETFALVTLLAIAEYGLDPARVNIYGGACAQGHPVGSTGARIVLTLINALRNTGGRRGMATLCLGGGEATALAVELIPDQAALRWAE